MTPDPVSSDFDDDERQFVADAGLPDGAAPWHACPSLSLLLAADEGVLTPDTQERVASHVAGCAFCRSLVQDVKEAGLGVPTDEEHERIQARVRSEAVSAEVHGSAARPAQRWAGMQGLALAASLVLVAGVGWYAWSLQQRAGTLEQTLGTLRDSATQDQRRVAVLEGQLAALRAQVERPGGEPNVPVVDLEPLGARRASEATRRFSVPRNARFVTLILQVDGAGNAGNVGGLTVEIRDERGEPRFSIEGLQASSMGVVTVLVPRAALPDGDAAITLVRAGDGRLVTVGEYRARFEPAGGSR
jgi:hypothetical protein